MQNVQQILGNMEFNDYMREIHAIVDSIKATPHNHMPQSSGKKVYYDADFNDYESWSAIK